MNLLYWNLKSNKNEEYIALLIKEHSIDIAIFSEYSGTDFSTITHTLLSDTYQFYQGYGGCEKVVMLAKKTIQVEINREHSRYVLYSVISDSSKYIVAGTHLPSNPHTDADGRKMVIRELIADLKEQEKIHKHSYSIIIGDLNASPFDEELIQKDAFNTYTPIYPNKMLLDENIAKEIDEKQEVSVENDQELIDLLRSIFSSQRVARIIRMMVLEMEGDDKKTN